MGKHTGLSSPISSLSLLLVQTQVARWKAAAPEQLTGAHLYLDIDKSGYFFHGYSGVVLLEHHIIIISNFQQGWQHQSNESLHLHSYFAVIYT